jgi:hypothetical protein
MPSPWIEILRMASFLVGAYLVVGTLLSAIKTFVVPRSMNVWLTRVVFRFWFGAFNLRMRRATTYEQRDSMMALFAPVALLSLPLVWVMLNLVGFMFIDWGLEPRPLEDVFRLSGSSLLTLGFAVPETTPLLISAFLEAAIGLVVIALLIAYLPTMYSAFSQRELVVSMLEARADVPPSPVTLITRVYLNDSRGLEALQDLWETWEVWFAQIAETHTSLGALTFFRSPRPDISWVTAAGAILDAASLVESTIDKPMDVRARLCIRAGFTALRHLADFFRMSYDPDPKPTDPISITRAEYDEVYDQLKAAGLPVVADRDQAWRDYAGWRVNYDSVLLALAELTMAPYAPWVSDRGLPRRRQMGLFGLFKNGKSSGEVTHETATLTR